MREALGPATPDFLPYPPREALQFPDEGFGQKQVVIVHDVQQGCAGISPERRGDDDGCVKDDSCQEARP